MLVTGEVGKDVYWLGQAGIRSAVGILAAYILVNQPLDKKGARLMLEGLLGAGNI
ncbi:MAG: hypothetical protein HY730_03375 [Candidatus Tectomicrobia bacterium]|uniref:Uncharacterized protein n=1 Tax=Tectimicrobiota bacterium TaxID=2528274 RepID=A0A933GKA0_UNCTE|nr:hypothetical protein [Candidatus Tectomicrobia bacterium]